MPAMQRLPRWLGSLVATVAIAGPAAAIAADAPNTDEVDTKLAGYEAETGQLAEDLPRPDQPSTATSQRRLLDAQIAYALGDYDAAAVSLFDLASHPGPDRDTAAFYLAESLFQKADRGAARGYYEQVVAAGNVSSKYYQPALERLIEIAIVGHDEAAAKTAVDSLDRISPGLRLPSVPYIRGKLAYAQGKQDEAIAYFQDVAKGSDLEMQAAYYTATTYVAKQDLQRATDIFTDLINRKPRTANDRRIIELSQLALGRIYYERDQASKSIDSYLLVDRHSDLFPDALYEVGWVYVKNKQFDKALRALELLSRSDPGTTKTPTVSILEGNLRVRKAQMIRNAIIQGTLDNRDPDDPSTEYDKAAQIFSETHDMYVPSYAALAQIVDAKSDPSQFLNQIAGRYEHVFQAAAPLPEAAVQYLRDEPEVQRVVAVEGDLGEIHADIAETEAMIARLEGVLAAGDKTAVYPVLAARRQRIGAIEDDLIRIRASLADQAGGGSEATLARRQQLAAYLASPAAAEANKQLTESAAGFDRIDETVGEIDDAIGSTQAISVAMRKFASDTPSLPADQRALLGSLDEAAREAQSIENELDGVRREIQLGRDLAQLGDGTNAAARAARRQLKATEDAEWQALGNAQPALTARAARAAKLADQLDQIEVQIDGVVDQGLRDARSQLTELRATLASYKGELAGYEADAKAVGGSVLGASFKDVTAKLYDIVIRSDVGNVDVAWSQKADTDDDLKRLNLSRQRELKQLKDEFKDILDAGTTKPSAPKKIDMPRPESTPPSGSPDQRGGPPPDDRRVSPTSAPSAPAAPTVRPEDSKAPAKSSKTSGKAGSSSKPPASGGAP